MKIESRFVEKINGNTLRCIICPRMCIIKPGKKGFCNTKINEKGKIISLTYGELSAFAVDPIEKKPLSHFYPGSLALSISSVGCSFTCPWCQNWHISTSSIDDHNTKFVSPNQVVEAAINNNCTSIAYTYNEPLINLNYVEDVSRLAYDNGIKNVLVTNGYVSLKALEQVVDVIDAANVDWKAFNKEFYRKYCSGELEDVLDATVYMNENGVHVEVTFLIIPNTNDRIDETRDMTRYIVKNMGSDIPLHLSRFYPMYKFKEKPTTPVGTLVKAREIAIEEGLRYVFIGNVPNEGYEDTVCPKCRNHVVRRRRYRILDWDLNKHNYCNKCGYEINIKGNREIHHSF
jgi:pyruvate formate lyase activating enzyme